MSDGDDDIKRMLDDIGDIFFRKNQYPFLGRSGKRSRNDYFSANMVNYADKPYLNLTSKLDGTENRCYTKQEAEKTMNDIVDKKNHYDTLIENIKEENAGIRFTPQMYNDLGGQNSVLLKNTERMEIVNLFDKFFVQFELNKQASKEYDAFCVRLYNEYDRPDEYIYALRTKGEFPKWEQYLSGDAALEKNLMETLALDENACLSNKREGYLFSENEVNKDGLKQAGIKWSDLSEVQKRDLLKGKETTAVTITSKNKKGKNVYQKGHLKLSRINANSADIIFRPTTTKGLKMTPILKM